jgi:hypothetical protein
LFFNQKSVQYSFIADCTGNYCSILYYKDGSAGLGINADNQKLSSGQLDLSKEEQKQRIVFITTLMMKGIAA